MIFSTNLYSKTFLSSRFHCKKITRHSKNGLVPEDFFFSSGRLFCRTRDDISSIVRPKKVPVLTLKSTGTDPLFLGSRFFGNRYLNKKNFLSLKKYIYRLVYEKVPVLVFQYRYWLFSKWAHWIGPLWSAPSGSAPLDRTPRTVPDSSQGRLRNFADFFLWRKCLCNALH